MKIKKIVFWAILILSCLVVLWFIYMKQTNTTLIAFRTIGDNIELVYFTEDEIIMPSYQSPIGWYPYTIPWVSIKMLEFSPHDKAITSSKEIGLKIDDTFSSPFYDGKKLVYYDRDLFSLDLEKGTKSREESSFNKLFFPQGYYLKTDPKNSSKKNRERYLMMGDSEIRSVGLAYESQSVIGYIPEEDCLWYFSSSIKKEEYIFDFYKVKDMNQEIRQHFTISLSAYMRFAGCWEKEGDLYVVFL